MSESKHIDVASLKKLNHQQDFINMIIEDYGENWKGSTMQKICKVHEPPKRFPCHVSIGVEIDEEAMWGSGRTEYYVYYYS